MPQEYILSAKGLVKEFPGVRALDNVDFEIAQNETLGLAGANGAGKSTLIKILSGMHRPNAGKIFFGGKEVDISSPRKAHLLGINTTYQEINLVPHLTVSDNIFLGQEIERNKLGQVSFIDRNKQFELTDNLLQDLGISNLVKSGMRVDKLGSMELGIIQIAKAVVRRSRLLIMDEPTSLLSKKEISILFQTMARLRATNSELGIIFITHNLEEFKEICNRIIILRDGRRAGTLSQYEISVSAISNLMIGHSVEEEKKTTKEPVDETVLQIENLNVDGVLKNIGFSLKRGEIVGLTGLVGSGKTELLTAIFGHLQRDSGTIKIEGKSLDIKSPIDAIKLGIGLVPEERKLQGLFLNMMIQQNITMAGLNKVSKWGIINAKLQGDISNNFIRDFAIDATGPRQNVGTLSGGNQQKVVISKWMMLKPRILLLDEVTRGIDVGAKVEVWKLVKQMAEQGTSVIVASGEVEEVLRLSDRVLVMANGAIACELVSSKTSRAEVLRFCIEKTDDMKALSGDMESHESRVERGSEELKDDTVGTTDNRNKRSRIHKKDGIFERLGLGIWDRFRRQPLILILLGIVIILSLIIPSFSSIGNIESNAFQIVSIGFIVLGEMLVILTGGIDLSVGSVMAFSACLMSGLIVKNSMPIQIAILLALFSGAAAGLISGIVVTYLRVAPFVATLSIMGIFRGAVLIYTGRAPISGLPEFFDTLGSGSIYGIPISTGIMIIIAILIFILLNYSKIGVSIYAVGGNETAAFLSGVHVRKTKIIVYCTSGILSSLAGIFMASRLVSAQPLMGLGWELTAITAAVIGGISLSGGVGSVGGALLGLLIVQAISNGMNLMNILMYSQQIITGLIMLFALMLISWRRRVERR
jgi:ABC-type sugar transport system ATPase subunit/ribose/xylose/arabinose/galactoside ABC-type transport system permease subunit